MRPVVFEGCFGWLHSASRNHGVILCGPIGEDAAIMHRCWREFAEQLAAAGLPTLRFDYLGTGDSIGDSQGPGQVDAWLQSISGAARFLLEDAAVEKLTLVGFRFGATLALAYAEQVGGVDGLALLAPVTSGRAFCRELAILARLRQGGEVDEDHLEAHGILLPVQAVARLQDFEILQGDRRPAARALILARDDLPTAPHLADRMRRLGVEVEEGDFTDYPLLRWQPDGTPFPAAAFKRVIEWILPGAQPATPHAVCAGEVNIPTPDICETAVVFGPAPGLFGVLCEPPGPRIGARPAIVFVTPGKMPHVGYYRMWVLMARQFAREGFTSLRFDVAGAGDSPARADHIEPGDLFRREVEDVRTALDWLGERGISQSILIGYCWGAKVACNVTLSEPRVAAQFLIHPWHQFWIDRTSDFHTLVRYLRIARKPSTWRSIFSGAVPAPVLRGAARRLTHGILTALAKPVSATAAPRQAEARAAAHLMQGLTGRGVHTVLVYGEDDWLLEDLEEYFGADRDRLAERLGVGIRLVPGVGPFIWRRPVRDNLTAILTEHLCTRYP